MQKGKRVINAIIDWDDNDVWEYLNNRGIAHCKLYDEGYKRIGCIGCPMSTHKVQELQRYPKYYENYLKAIERFLPAYLARCKKKHREPFRKTAQDWMNWWLELEPTKEEIDGQIDWFEDIS
jgi:phosphoadenosine phosphosulfate reductase